MQPGWTLKVKDFGKIAEAEVTLKPLTVFIGKNNSGKSWLASLIWGLFNPRGVVFPREEPANDKSYKKCASLLKKAVDAAKKSSGEQIELDAAPFSKWFEALLAERKSEFCAKLLGYDGLLLGGVFVRGFGSSQVKLTTRTLKFGSAEKQLIGVHSDNGDGYFSEDISIYDLAQAVCMSIILGEMWSGTVYVPAGRTGIVLSLPSLMSHLIGESIEGVAGRLSFPIPVKPFMQRLVSPGPTERGSELADFVENNIIGGSVDRVTASSPVFSFRPNNGDVEIPLHASSSLVSELGPVASILKSGFFRSLIIEEPEAHLHLEAQTNMARAIARMVNTGINVLITTHSDTFLQQINNLMNLHRHPRRDEVMAKWGLEQRDLIDPDKLAGYEFVERDGRSYVEPMPCGPGGLVAESMNAVLRDLTKFTYDVLEVEDE